MFLLFFFISTADLAEVKAVPSDNALQWFVSGFDNQEA